MSEIDWSQPNREEYIYAYCCDPNTLEVRSTLSEVIANGSTLTFGYETDTRVSGSLKIANTNYVDNSLIRITHVIPEYNYINPLATMVVTKDPADQENGIWTTTYELHSTLTMIEKDLLPYHYVVAQGAKCSAVVKELLGDAKRPYYFVANANDYVFPQPVIYEVGDSRLSDLYDITGTASDRIDVDGNGYITIDKYVNPSSKTPIYSIDLDGYTTNVLSGVSRSSDKLSVPTRAIVYFTKSNGQDDTTEIIAYKDSTTGVTSAARGYTVAVIKKVSKLDPETQANAQSIADTYLSETNSETLTWELSMLYYPLSAGDVVLINFNDGPDVGSHYALVKNIQLSLDTMIMKLTLKEV